MSDPYGHRHRLQLGLELARLEGRLVFWRHMIWGLGILLVVYALVGGTALYVAKRQMEANLARSVARFQEGMKAVHERRLRDQTRPEGQPSPAPQEPRS